MSLFLEFIRANYTGPLNSRDLDKALFIGKEEEEEVTESHVVATNADLCGLFPVFIKRQLFIIVALEIIEFLSRKGNTSNDSHVFSLHLWKARILMTYEVSCHFKRISDSKELNVLSKISINRSEEIRKEYNTALSRIELSTTLSKEEINVQKVMQYLLLSEIYMVILRIGEGDSLYSDTLLDRITELSPWGVDLIGVEALLGIHSDVKSTILTSKVTERLPEENDVCFMSVAPTLKCKDGVKWVSPLDTEAYKEDALCPEMFIMGSEMRPVPTVSSTYVPVESVNPFVCILLYIKALEASSLGQGADDEFSRQKSVAFIESLIRLSCAETKSGELVSSFVPPSIRIGALQFRATLLTDIPSHHEICVLQTKRIRES